MISTKMGKQRSLSFERTHKKRQGVPRVRQVTQSSHLGDCEKLLHVNPLLVVIEI